MLLVYQRELFRWDQGTGSYPPGLNGLHRKTRQIAIKLPLIAPYLYIAR